MSVRGWRLLAAAGALLCVATASRAGADFAGQGASGDARYAADWVVDAGDNDGRPFAVVDKKGARLYVFERTGRLLGESPVLLGLTRGDRTVVDPARKPGAPLTRAERTTPAGRFATMPGHNDKGEDIVWIDYDAALAIHRLRPAPAWQQRPGRLASAAAGHHRISEGCVVVPVAFYESVVRPGLGRRRGVVYVLPDSTSVQAMFNAAQLMSRAP